MHKNIDLMMLLFWYTNLSYDTNIISHLDWNCNEITNVNYYVL